MGEQVERLLKEALELFEPRMADASGVRYLQDWLDDAKEWRNKAHKQLSALAQSSQHSAGEKVSDE